MKIMNSIKPITCVLSVLYLSCAGVQDQNTAELLLRYNRAANRYDIPTLHAMLSEDIVWVLGTGDTLIGKGAALAPHEYDATVKARLSIKSYVIKGVTAEFVLEETSKRQDMLGIPPIVHYPRFVFRDGLLVRKEPSRLSDFSAAGDSIQKSFRQWIKGTHPEALAQLQKPNGRFNHSRATGELLLRLAREWKKNE